MNEFNFNNDPALKNMHPMKLKIMADFIHTAEGKPIAQALPALLSAKQQLTALGLSFTPEETSLLMDSISNNLSPENKLKLDAIKAFIHQNSM